jgi:hypothetical protein
MPNAVPAATRVVWLPGAYIPRRISDAGFSRALARGKALSGSDLGGSGAGARGRSQPLERLRSEIVLPARAAGVASGWPEYRSADILPWSTPPVMPRTSPGCACSAPYLGNRMLTGEIAGAQGLADGSPGELAETDEERRIWRYIKTVAPSRRRCILDLGARIDSRRHMAAGAGSAGRFGRSDRRRPRLATWSRLWEKFLDSRFT